MGVMTRLASGHRAVAHPKGGLGNSIQPSSGGGNLAATVSTRYTTPGQPVFQDWDALGATRQGYLGHAYVMRCVRLRAEVVAGLGFRTGPDPENPSVWVPGSPLGKLLGPATPQSPGGPNPQTSSRAFWIWSIIQRIVTGRMAWELQRVPSTKEIVGLWPLVSAALDPIASPPGSQRWYDGYVYHTPTGDIPMTLDRVMYDWRMSAEDPRQAESVLQSASLPVQLAIACDKYMWGLLSRGMVATKMVITPPFAEAASSRAWQDQFLAAFSGYDNAGSTIFAEIDPDEDESTGKAMASVQVIDLSMKGTDAQMLQTVQMAKTDIEVALGVPESLIGNASQRIYANADSEYRNFWTTTAINDVAELEDAVNLRLAPQLGEEACWFDLSNVVALQPPSVFAPPQVKDMLDEGIMTPQQVAEVLNLTAVDAQGEDVYTAPIGEEVDEASSAGGAGGRAFVASRRRGFHVGEGYREVHHGMRLAEGVFVTRLPLNTKTYRSGVWRVERRRERVSVSSGRRAHRVVATPELASEITAKVARMRRRRELGIRSGSKLVASGIALKAADTGRVLMLQRALDEKDPASGKLEFPGGHIEPGEDSLDAAKREWGEEVGVPLPDGNVAGSWTSPNGVYRGHVVVVPHEADVAINPTRRKVTNPDDPKGKYRETAVWLDPDHAAENPAVRDEVSATSGTWSPVVKAAQPTEGDRSLDLSALADELLAVVQ